MREATGFRVALSTAVLHPPKTSSEAMSPERLRARSGRSRIVVALIACVMTLYPAGRLMAVAADAPVPAPGSTVTIGLDEEDWAVLGTLGEGVVGRALPPAPIQEPTRYFPLREMEWTYLVANGDDKGSHKAYRLTAKSTRATSTAWQWELPDEETLYLDVEDDTTIGLSSQADLQQNTITTFSPVENILDATLSPGQTKQRRVAVEVFDLHDPAKRKYAGSLTATDTYVGTYEVHTADRTFQAALFRTTYEGKVGPAKIVDQSYRFFAEDVGVVAMVTQSRISAMLFYKKNTKRSLVLVSGPRELAR